MRLMGSWVLALFLAIMLILIADQTLFPATAGKNVVFPLLAQKSGIPLWEPTGRFVVGLVDVLAALLVFVPFTRRLGGMLSAALCLGALVAYLLWFHDTSLPVEIGATDTDGGMLFDLTLALLGASVLLVFIHPGRRKG
ncbi:MAG: hypothetical protein GC155_12065 [Alphaproteobacteria bacterium]|nr:hypothetical protein [Alphaproteobacteria bacterium]